MQNLCPSNVKVILLAAILRLLVQQWVLWLCLLVVPLISSSPPLIINQSALWLWLLLLMVMLRRRCHGDGAGDTCW